MRLRRIWRFWPTVLIAFIALVLYAAWPGRSKFTVSEETTHVTGPLDEQGFVDYQAALNERLGKGITPEKNGHVMIVQAMGPKPEGATMPPEYYQRLGIAEPPEQGEYLLSWDKYFQANLKTPPDPIFTYAQSEDEWRDDWNNRIDRAMKWPWKQQHPEIVAWLKRNEKPLALMIEASRRPEYFNPLVSKNTPPQSARVMNSLLPTVQKCREVARQLTCRAMSKLGEKDFDGAWQDLLACQRLGRLVAGGGTIIEGLVGIAMVAIASNAQVTLLGHSTHSSQQILTWLDDLRNLPAMPPLAYKVDTGERFIALDTLMSIACNGPGYLEKLDGRADTRPKAIGLPGKLFTRSIDYDPAFRLANKTYDRVAAACRLPDRAGRKLEYAKVLADVQRMKAEVSQVNGFDRIAMSKERRGELIGYVVIALVLPAMEKMQDAQDRIEQTERNLQVACALAAYKADSGRYPAQLEELSPKYLAKIPGDLFSGKPLIYKPAENGYLLYSVGVNEQDDGGRWIDDEPRGDDPRVRMPVTEPVVK